MVYLDLDRSLPFCGFVCTYAVAHPVFKVLSRKLLIYLGNK